MDVLVVGLGVTGDALVRHAARQGWTVTVVEDAPAAPGYQDRRRAAEALGATVVEAPGTDAWPGLVAAARLVVPSPGVPAAHPVYAAAVDAGVDVVSEIELASEAATVPIVAVTGTNGKTTVTTLVAAMLDASGLHAVAAGNIGRPLIEAVLEPADVVVAEVSSFQLEYTRRFHPRVAVVTNVADDHLDWHPTFEHYRAAKARIFANQVGDDVLVVDADDEAAAGLGHEAPARVLRCSASGRPGADARVANGNLMAPRGTVLLSVEELARRHRHDVSNALVASTAALEVGATVEGVTSTLRSFTGLRHRVELVGDADGVRFYDDSKATNPHAALSAISGFDSVVLLAGGRNKGLDLGVLASAAPRLRAVVAFGEAGREVEAVFDGVVPVRRVATVAEAAAAGADLAEPGDAVLLSPGCASFDAYPGYAARGDDFAAAVRRLLDAREASTS
ncbi:MAG TPA: UDP-N-acetylmuramoyl-L-alanine--D-glutamate ligase [Acidimicrobiia bacterium]|nr:UDP-N-acetylmuramoyl-L-alanine--D-glutamate ligase [Acidimicrobiia bacterium]